jgi:hypothetical protein
MLDSFQLDLVEPAASYQCSQLDMNIVLWESSLFAAEVICTLYSSQRDLNIRPRQFDQCSTLDMGIEPQRAINVGIRPMLMFLK